MALVREGQVVHVLATSGSSQVFPRIAALRPLVAAPEADGATRVTVWGYNLGEETGEEDGSDVVLARSQGGWPGGRGCGGGWVAGGGWGAEAGLVGCGVFPGAAQCVLKSCGVRASIYVQRSCCRPGARSRHSTRASPPASLAPHPTPAHTCSSLLPLLAQASTWPWSGWARL